jgi:nicotinamide mononucleotide adenylyltransferase
LETLINVIVMRSVTPTAAAGSTKSPWRSAATELVQHNLYYFASMLRREQCRERERRREIERERERDRERERKKEREREREMKRERERERESGKACNTVYCTILPLCCAESNAEREK